MRSLLPSSSEGKLRDILRESDKPPSRKHLPAWAPAHDEGRCVSGQSLTLRCWWGRVPCLEQVEEEGTFLLPCSKENEKAPQKAFRDQGAALVPAF